MSAAVSLGRPPLPPILATVPILPHGWRIHMADSPLARAAAAEFTSGIGEGMLQFLDTALPECRRMIDFGGGIGLTALYAAAQGARVDVFEPSPANAALLDGNLAANPHLAARIHRHPAGTDAASGIAGLGLSPDTLLRIDAGGAEYQIVPALAPLLARSRPFLHLSFHPFSIGRGTDEYLTHVARLRAALAVAEAVAPYRHMYFHTELGWTRIDRRDRLTLLAQYLLKPKPGPHGATGQYGFTDCLALSEVALPLG